MASDKAKLNGPPCAKQIDEYFWRQCLAWISQRPRTQELPTKKIIILNVNFENNVKSRCIMISISIFYLNFRKLPFSTSFAAKIEKN
jgi:hypothetical protein